MPSPPLSLAQVIAFLRDVISSCRAQAGCDHVPEFARARLHDAAEHVEFFLHRHALRRAFCEAKRATAMHGAVERFLRASTDASARLRDELGAPWPRP